MPHSRSHSHEDSHEQHDRHNGFWAGCSERFWGDDEHEHAAKKIAFIAIIVVVIAVVVIVTVAVICCKRKRKVKQALQKKQQIQNAVVDPANNPKAIEAYGPGGVSPSVVVSVCPNAPLPQGTDGEKKDPRLTVGVWSPPPAYEEPQ